MRIRLCTMMLCLIATLDSAVCQEAVWITGSVLDQRSRPIPGAIVSLAARGLRDTTSSSGSFELKSTTAVREGTFGSWAGVPSLTWNGAAIRILLPSQSQVSVDIYTLQGRLVCRALNKSLPAGVHVQPIPRGSMRDGPYVLTCQVNLIRRTALFASDGVMQLNGAGTNGVDGLTKKTAVTDTLLVSSAGYIPARAPLTALISNTDVTLYRVAHIGLAFSCLLNSGSCGINCSPFFYNLYDGKNSPAILSGSTRDTIWFDHTSGFGTTFTAEVYCQPADVPQVFIWQPPEVFNDTVLITHIPNYDKKPLIHVRSDTTFVATQTMSFTVTASDSDQNDRVTMWCTKTKAGSTFDTTSGNPARSIYRWATAYTDSGMDTMTIWASDGVLTDSQVVHVLCKPIYPGPSGLRVGLPNGGEEYKVGDTMKIMWYCDFAKCTADVKIGIKISAQSPTVFIDSLIQRISSYYMGSIGTYTWTVPRTVHNPVGGYDMILESSYDARIRIQAMGTANVNQRDDSDGGFIVMPTVAAP